MAVPATHTPPRRYRRVAIGALGLVAATALSGCSVGSSNFGSPHGVTKQGEIALHDWRGTFVLSAVVGGIVLGLIAWCALAYRRKPGQTELPRQFQYHIPLEITYTVIPIIIVVAVFAWVYGAEDKIDAVPKNPNVVIRVDAFQWGWKFTYDKPATAVQIAGNINHYPTLVLPSDETVEVHLYSDDVNHSFYVPEFLFKRDIIPGVHNTITFNITTNGLYKGECTQLCGVYHSYMRFYVRVISPSQFTQWMSTQVAALGKTPSSSTGA
jgi:cytochrome c oxidase subunit 2